VYRTLWRRGRDRWSFELDFEPFGALAETFELTEDCDADEFYLAVGCDQGLAVALEAFEDTYLSIVRPLLGRQGMSRELIDEAQQRLRTELLVHPDDASPIRLLRYAGSGRLASVIRVSAVRGALYLKTHQLGAGTAVKKTVDAYSETLHTKELWGRGDPEVSVIKRENQERFKQCFATAVAELSDHDRAILSFFYLDELKIDAIAKLFQVHRSTMSRQLTAVREQLLRKLRREWRKDADLPLEDEASLLLSSQLDLSMSRLLGRR
jgi:RNA polymerase sigma-70 factor (ECF subfamily)